MSTPMVQATKARLKRMTRRLKGLERVNRNPDSSTFLRFETNDKGQLVAVFDDPRLPFHEVAIAPYQLGDILWVRENFRVNSWVPDDGEVTFRYEADGAVSPYICFDDEDRFIRYWEQSCIDLDDAGYVINENECYADYDYKDLRLRPSIFLPKEAARIWLQVTDIKVERLHDISQDDIIAEGVCYGEEYNSELCKWRDSLYGIHQTRKKFWEKTWRSINGDESWDANPWVWVVSFEVLSTTGKPENI